MTEKEQGSQREKKTAGKNMKKWTRVLLTWMIAFLLTACGTGSAAIPENPGNVYRAVVSDEAGKPVEDVGVQLCSDELCMSARSDAQGIAVFKNAQEGVYTVHVGNVPDGFAEDDTEYAAPETYGDIVIVLKTAR